MRATRDSTAYKHYEERYEPKEKPEIRKPTKNQQKAKSMVTPGLIVGIAAALMAAVYILYCQMQLTQITADINEKNTKLDDLVAQNISLSSKYAYEMDLDEVEEYAIKNLGMVKMDTGQIEYIELTNPDKITVTNPELTPGRVIQILVDVFFRIVEYIR